MLRTPTPPGGQLSCWLVISIGGRHCGKRLEPIADIPVVIRAPGPVSELECDRVAQRHLLLGGKGSKGSGHGRLGQPWPLTPASTR